MSCHIKRIISFFLVIFMLITIVGCSGDATSSGTLSSGTSNSQGGGTYRKSTSSPENDIDLGLKNIKIDITTTELTEAQRQVLEYFDDDYLSVPSYEFLRRYPGVFQDAQLCIWGTVAKVISWNSDSFELILLMDVGPVEYEWGYEEYEGDYLLLTGESENVAYMEGDTLLVYGRYTGLETIEIDGTSYTIPKISMQGAYFDTSQAPNDIYRYIPKFDLSFVKGVATSIFGDDFEIREPIAGVDISEMQYEMWYEVCGAMPCFVVELENQSNAKFSKYLFYTDISSDVYGGDRIQVATDAMGNSNIYRAIEFSADFEHFFLFTYDTSLETLTLEYYDSEFNKIWKREFSETSSADYDYTKNNIYLVANNELYIINIETGEDTYAPSYIGEKLAIRKLEDGILLVSQSKSDGVMKVGLDGSIIWKTNLSDDTHSVEGIQVVDDRIIISQYYWSSPSDRGTHYLVLNSETGEIEQDAVSMT